MPEGSDVDALLTADRGTFVRVDGLPFEEGPSDWHVNDHIYAEVDEDPLANLLSRFNTETGPQRGTHGLILQRADASEEWIGLTVYEGEINFGFHVVDPLGEPEEIDVDAITVEEVDRDA